MPSLFVWLASATGLLAILALTWRATIQRQSRRIDALRLRLEAEDDFVAARLHADPRAGSLLAIDAASAMLFVASRQGQSIEDYRLPVEQIESVRLFEDNRVDAPRAGTGKVRSIRLEIALPDERRSLHTFEFLSRPAPRGSRRYCAARDIADAWAGLLAGEAGRGPELVAAGDAVSSTEVLDENAQSATFRTIDSLTAPAMPSGERWLHGALMTFALFTVVAGGWALVGDSGDVVETPSIASALPVGARAELDAVVEPGSIDQRLERLAAAAMAETKWPRHHEVLAVLLDLESIVEEVVSVDTTPLDEAGRVAAQRLRGRIVAIQNEALPKLRERFARALRHHAALPVDAHTAQEPARGLDLARRDLGEPVVRADVREALRDDLVRLRFDYVEMREWRGGPVIERFDLVHVGDEELVISVGSGT